MTFSSHHRRLAGFTLIELLTVVAIISLLIGILLPSLSKARDQAKRATVAGLLSATDKALEMFHNDFKEYPVSSLRQDPITEWPNLDGTGAPVDDDYLSGAHWLARALVGHDYGGVDAKGYVMQNGFTLNLDPALTYDELRSDIHPPGKYADRKAIYIDGEIFAADNDATKFPGSADGDFAPTKRMVVVDDAFDSPVLYYRANQRATTAFDISGVSCTYRLADNQKITGLNTDPTPGSGTTDPKGWDFASVGSLDATGLIHKIGAFGDPDDVHDYPNSFMYYLHSESACKAAGKIKPYNAEKFILITAGKDGRYGTDDDVTNFKSGL